MATPYYERALNQKVYPGVGDIDDCWVVASIWAVRRRTQQSGNLPNSKVFRAAAGDPDDGYRDGGTLDEIMRGIHRLYPHIDAVKYARQYGWSGLVAYLNKGYTASIAVRSRYLPAAYRYGFYGTHQVAIFKRDGNFYMMNPLQPQGSAPVRISESAIKAATYKFANGWVMAALIPRINLGTFRMKATTYRRWTRTASGGWKASTPRVTRGWSATACPPATFTVAGKRRKMVFISTGGNAGYWIELTGSARTYTP